jgi:Ser/Thr protein kinase RdoA (MazF antagonist)
MNDIAIANQHILMLHAGGLHQPLRKPEFLEQFLRVFLEGYRQENAIDAASLAHLDSFIAYRRILLYLVMPDWRRARPGLNQSWQDMIRKNPPIYERLKLL